MSCEHDLKSLEYFDFDDWRSAEDCWTDKVRISKKERTNLMYCTKCGQVFVNLGENSKRQNDDLKSVSLEYLNGMKRALRIIKERHREYVEKCNKAYKRNDRDEGRFFDYSALTCAVIEGLIKDEINEKEKSIK